MSAAQSTVKTRIFIISDTHDDVYRSEGEPRSHFLFPTRPETFSRDGAFRPPLPKCDILLHSGDLTMLGIMEEYEKSLSVLKQIDAELKLVIAGNHDLSLHKSYYLNDKNAKGKLYAEHWMDGKYKAEYAEQAEKLWTGPEAAAAGVTYLTEGLHTFSLKNGARFTVYASPWQPEFFNWAFNYPHNEDRWNPPELVSGRNTVPAPPERDPHPIPRDASVDLMMTHGPPHMHLDRVESGHRAGCPHLLKALDRFRPRLHCFGHIHEAWGAERVIWQSRDKQAADGSESRGQLGETTETIGGTDDGGMGVSPETTNVIRPHDREVIDQRAAYVDVSSASSKPLRFGEESLLINSCVVDIGYSTVNAGWLVDLDLPLGPSRTA